MKKLLLILGLAFCVQFVFAQNFSFLNYSNAEGLPQSQVNAITQDDEGYIWVGTLGGLAKFNGQEFEVYSVKTGLYSNRVTSIHSFKDEKWIGHEGGVTRKFESTLKSWALPNPAKKSNVTSIAYFAGTHWFATNGGGLFYLFKNEIYAYKLDGEELRIRSMEIHAGKLMLATRAGLISIDENKAAIRNKELNTISLSSVKSFQGNLIIASYMNGIFILGANQKVTLQIPSDDNYTIKHLSIAKDGTYLLSTNNGVVSIKPSGEKLIYNQKNGLETDAVSSTFIDNQGGIWIGTEGKGLKKLADKSFVYFNKTHGLPSDLVIAMQQTENSNYWVGSYDNGAFLMDFNGKILQHILLENRVWAIEKSSDNSYFFATDNRLVRIDKSKVISYFNQESGAPGNNITCLKTIGIETWIGGEKGISRYSNGKLEFIASSINTGIIRNIAFHNGKLIVASDGGLFELDKNELRKHPCNFQKSTFNLAIDNQNRLWLGTEEGLFYLQNGKIIAQQIGQGAADDFVNFIRPTKDGIYVGTNNGLYFIDQLFTIQQFGLFQGLVTLESNINSSIIDSKGFLWFGSASGLIRYKIEVKTANKVWNPTITLKNCQINYQTLPQKLLINVKQNKGTSTFAYSKNTLSFYFDPLFLSDPSAVLMRFRLVGLSDDWTDWQKDYHVYYTKIPAGEYVLQAQSKTNFGKTITIWKHTIIIKPPFYATWWFIGLCILFLAFLVWQIMRLRIHQERLKSQRELAITNGRLIELEQQSLNASMNRHFIFNSLNSIQYFINVQDKLAANRYLTNFAKLIRKNLDSSMSNNGMVTLEDEIERLELYLSLENLRFRGKFTFEIINKVGDLEEFMIPSMLLQPFAENALLHGILPKETVCGKIVITIERRPELIEISIFDDGVGIDDSKQTKSDFKGDHESKGMEITTKRIALIGKASNEKYKLIGPKQVNDSDGKSVGTIVFVEIPD